MSGPAFDFDDVSLPWEGGRFDCVLSWFTSFGYFDDGDNRHVLREAHRVLRPGGKLLIENNNLAGILPGCLGCLLRPRRGAAGRSGPPDDHDRDSRVTG